VREQVETRHHRSDGRQQSVTRVFRHQQTGSAKAAVSPAPMRTARRWRKRKADLKPESNGRHQVH
jgi:hypothetical protein